MALFQARDIINDIPLSERSQWLLFAPVWMLFPQWRKRVMSKPIDYISPGAGMLRSELRSGLPGTITIRRRPQPHLT